MVKRHAKFNRSIFQLFGEKKLKREKKKEKNEERQARGQTGKQAGKKGCRGPSERRQETPTEEGDGKQKSNKQYADASRQGEEERREKAQSKKGFQKFRRPFSSRSHSGANCTGSFSSQRFKITAAVHGLPSQIFPQFVSRAFAGLMQCLLCLQIQNRVSRKPKKKKEKTSQQINQPTIS